MPGALASGTWPRRQSDINGFGFRFLVLDHPQVPADCSCGCVALEDYWDTVRVGCVCGNRCATCHVLPKINVAYKYAGTTTKQAPPEIDAW